MKIYLRWDFEDLFDDILDEDYEDAIWKDLLFKFSIELLEEFHTNILNEFILKNLTKKIPILSIF